MKDSRFLHFLKQFPSQFLLSALFLLVIGLYIFTNDQFLQRVADTILGGLLGVVTGRYQSSTPTVQAGKIDAEIKTDSIDLTQSGAIPTFEVKEDE